MGLRKAYAAFLLSAAVVASPAEAATYVITYTGHVTSGYDQTGVFGTAGANLAGLAFTAVYTLTAPMPGAQTYNDGITGYIAGGTDYARPSPMSGTITIGGLTFSNVGNSASETRQVNGLTNPSYGIDQIFHYANNNSISQETLDEVRFFNTIYSYTNNIINSSDYTDALNYIPQTGDISYGYFRTFEYDYINDQYLKNTVAELSNDRVTIAEVSPVPEPASWTMMILGFGLAGGAMRRRTATMAYA